MKFFVYDVLFVQVVAISLVLLPACAFCSDGVYRFCNVHSPDDVDYIFNFQDCSLSRGTVASSLLVKEARSGGILRTSVLSPGDTFEIVPLAVDGKQLVLYGGHRKFWVEKDGVVRCSRPGTSYRSSARGMVFRPYKDLPEGVDYFWMLKDGAKLHVLSMDLTKNAHLEFVPVISPYYDEVSAGDGKYATVSDLASSAGALAAVNGTFFSTGSNYGEPLGNVVVGGSIAYEVTDSALLKRGRCYFAYTSKRRILLEETTLPAQAAVEEVNRRLEKNGESVVSMIGGFGWLVRDSCAKGWAQGIERQFGANYYSSYVRRPQTVIGVSDDGYRVFFLTQEGYPHASRRYSLPELAEIASRLGAYNAVFADGGGSTSMYLRGRAVVRTEGLAKPRRVSTVLAVLEK